jgi:hypothetical protein
MLFNFEDQLVDVVIEKPYKNVFTIRASTSKALKSFRESSIAEMVKVPHHLYPYLIHIDMDSSPLRVSAFDYKKIEKLDRLTPEPACFVYEYAYSTDEGQVSGDYGYCWPDEIDWVTNNLMTSEKELLGDPVFLPLFIIPGELVGSPIRIVDGSTETTSFEDFDDETNNE